MTETMRAIEISEAGGPEVLTQTRRPLPVPEAGEIRIAIDYAGVNRPDLLQRAGLYNPPPGASDLPGLEAAGTINAIGPGVTRWKVGDPVCALLPGGGYAEYATTHEDQALAVPTTLTMLEAAALPETAFTVWSNVFMRGKLEAGEIFLVHGGTSGIGTMAIQLAKLFGARVFTTAGTKEKCETCQSLGAERAINYHNEDFVEVLRAEGGADLILDMVGGSYLPRNVRALADDGRLQQIAFLQGPKVEFNFAPVMTRRLSISGSTLRPQSITAKSAISEQLRRHVWPLIKAGRLRPVMDQVFDLEDVSKAHIRMESSAHIGKLVLKVR